MKKLIMTVVTVLLILTIGATQVFAAEAGRRNFTDRNGDGICDSQEQCQQDCADENTGRFCEIQSQCPGRNLQDENNNGICDNQCIQTNRGCANRPQGRHHGNGHKGGCR